MGIFDKKKKGRDDFDSPVEQIDLSTATAASSSDDDEEEEESSGDITIEVATPAAPPRAAASDGRPARGRGSEAPAKRRSSAGYGIDDAIALMRTLPSENVELVVQVVKHTLESTQIDIGSIIEDATLKEERLEDRNAVLRDEIRELEGEIETRRKEIAEIEADHAETTKVKERLVLAQKLTSPAKGDGAVRTSEQSEAASGEIKSPVASNPATSKPATLPPPPVAGAVKVGSHTVVAKK